MRAALKRIVLPALRERGFTGELPTLRRLGADATHLFTVQTSKWGGEFVVELGRARAGAYRAASGEDVAAAVLETYHLRDDDRARLRAVPNVLREVWFSYRLTLGGRIGNRLGRAIGWPAPVDPFERAARQVVALISECDRWWAGEERLPHVRSFAEQLEAQGGPYPKAPSAGPGGAGE